MFVFVFPTHTWKIADLQHLLLVLFVFNCLQSHCCICFGPKHINLCIISLFTSLISMAGHVGYSNWCEGAGHFWCRAFRLSWAFFFPRKPCWGPVWIRFLAEKRCSRILRRLEGWWDVHVHVSSSIARRIRMPEIGWSIAVTWPGTPGRG